MKFSLEERARIFATKAHAEAQQRRKYTDEPYIVHPAAVAEIIRSVTRDEVMLAAAWLHDTVEDTATTHEDIRSHFGEPVARLVAMLTNSDQPQAKNRAARKAAHFRHSAGTSKEAQTIKLADIIDNTRALIRYDPDFARVYLLEKRLQVTLLNAGSEVLRHTATEIIENGIQTLTEPPYNVPHSWFAREARKYR